MHISSFSESFSFECPSTSPPSASKAVFPEAFPEASPLVDAPILAEKSPPNLAAAPLLILNSCQQVEVGNLKQKKIKQRNLSLQPASELASFEVLMCGRQQLQIDCLFDDSSGQIMALAKRGSEKACWTLNGVVLTLASSSLLLDEEAIEQILMAIAPPLLAAVKVIENIESFSLSVQSLQLFARFCPQSCNQVACIMGSNPHFSNLVLVFRGESFSLCKEMVALIWPEFLSFLEPFKGRRLMAAGQKEMVDLTATKLSAMLIRLGLSFIIKGVAIEQLPLDRFSALFYLFHYIADQKRAPFFLHHLSSQILLALQNNAPLDNIHLDNAPLKALAQLALPLQLLQSCVLPSVWQNIELSIETIRSYCDRYIYYRLSNWPKKSTALAQQQFHQELMTIAPLITSLGHTWQQEFEKEQASSPAKKVAFEIADCQLKLLFPLKEVRKGHFHCLSFINDQKMSSPSIHLFNILSNCFPNMSDLTFIDCKFSRKSLEAIGKLQKLKRLQLQRCVGVGSKRALSNNLKFLQNLKLEELSLIDCSNVSLENNDLNWLSKSHLNSFILEDRHHYKNLPQLKSLGVIEKFTLNLEKNKNNGQYSALFQAIKNSPHLQQLELHLNGSCRFDDDLSNPHVRELKIVLKPTSKDTAQFMGERRNLISNIRFIVQCFSHLETLRVESDLLAVPDETLALVSFLNGLPSFKILKVNQDIGYLLDIANIKKSELNFKIKKNG